MADLPIRPKAWGERLIMNENRALSASTLARRPDLLFENSVIRPSTRSIQGPLASGTLEPKVMLVLLALVDGQGAVLGRDELMSECWPGVIVGDDAINRAIGEIRRVIRETGASFEIETIPRIGYRFVGKETSEPPAGVSQQGNVLSRRAAIASGAVAIAGLGAAALWYRNDSRERRVRELIEAGRRAYLLHDGSSGHEAENIFATVTRIAPDRPEGWGWLAASILASNDGGPGTMEAKAYDAARYSASRALALDAQEPNALTVMSNLRESLGDWRAYQSELEGILERSPGAIPACEYLTGFLQGLGYCRASWRVNEQGIAHEPFAPVFQQRRGLKCWIFGRIGEADRVFDRALRYWPDHPLVWHSYVATLAFTDRTEAARRIVTDALDRGAMAPQPAQLWRVSLNALESGATGDVAAARDVAIQLAPKARGLATNAIMILSHLGEVDAAYAIAEGQLQSRGRLIATSPDTDAAGRFYADENWRETQWMFTPAASRFREDDRFTGFCEAIGYLDHWRGQGAWPDDFVRGSLRVS